MSISTRYLSYNQELSDGDWIAINLRGKSLQFTQKLSLSALTSLINSPSSRMSRMENSLSISLV